MKVSISKIFFFMNIELRDFLMRSREHKFFGLVVVLIDILFFIGVY